MSYSRVVLSSPRTISRPRPRVQSTGLADPSLDTLRVLDVRAVTGASSRLLLVTHIDRYCLPPTDGPCLRKCARTRQRRRVPLPDQRILRSLPSSSHVQGKSNESERLLLLDGLSYSFQKGERPVIVGRNGAGKTSFLRLPVDQQPLTDGNTIVR